ncbi:ATP cone domain-containing protein [Methanobacterium sp. ACI-7]|uniref:ATP cone domain-containing protein n=1 Tax=unclassified Methanobacterium TaxID=2627676 RepID=UPI0039C09B4F
MTDVIKRNGKKEPFNEGKIRKSVKSAVKNAGFNPKEKVHVIEHASQDAARKAEKVDEIESKQIRDTILNDLEHDDQKVAQAWKNYEDQHGMNY